MADADGTSELSGETTPSEPATRFHPGARSRLTEHDRGRFSGPTLFDRIGRAVCEAGVLPRKELYEAWETARRIRRRFRAGPVFDLAAGHGLLGWLLLILDDKSPWARCVDTREPASAARLAEVLTRYWPRLAGRVVYEIGELRAAAPPEGALVASIHGCGALTDAVLDLAIERRLGVAVLPCCHSSAHCDAGDLCGWLPLDLAVDVTRAARLRAAGFEVWTMLLPGEITPRNRLLMGRPRSA